MKTLVMSMVCKNEKRVIKLINLITVNTIYSKVNNLKALTESKLIVDFGDGKVDEIILSSKFICEVNVFFYPKNQITSTDELVCLIGNFMGANCNNDTLYLEIKEL